MTSRRTVLSLAALGGVALATAAATPARAAGLEGFWYEPLQDAIAGLPEETATAAQVRLTGSQGVWERRSGVADVRTGAKVPVGARFRAGSVTKAFVATVVLQLAAEGRLQLDAPVSRYLPGLLPREYAACTVRHLLDHRTGLPSPTWPDGIEWQVEHRFDRYTPEQLVRLALRNEREYEPGTAQRYTNMGYIVAGLLIRRVTGEWHGAQVHRRLARPLGLCDTYAPGDDVDVRGPHARGYQTIDGRLLDVTRWRQTVTPAAGDLISSLADLDRFTAALLGGRLLPPAQQRELFALPAIEGATYSCGLQRLVQLPGGREIWGKSGARYGYSAAIAATTDGSSRVVYSVNSTDAKAEGTAPVIGRIIGAALGLL